MMRDFPKAKVYVREIMEVATNRVEYGPAKRNRLYAPQSKGDQE